MTTHQLLKKANYISSIACDHHHLISDLRCLIGTRFTHSLFKRWNYHFILQQHVKLMKSAKKKKSVLELFIRLLSQTQDVLLAYKRLSTWVDLKWVGSEKCCVNVMTDLTTPAH